MYTYLKVCKIVNFKYVQVVVCQLHLKKAVLKTLQWYPIILEIKSNLLYLIFKAPYNLVPRAHLPLLSPLPNLLQPHFPSYSSKDQIYSHFRAFYFCTWFSSTCTTIPLTLLLLFKSQLQCPFLKEAFSSFHLKSPPKSLITVYFLGNTWPYLFLCLGKVHTFAVCRDIRLRVINGGNRE